MEVFGNYIMTFIQTGGLFAPLLFISVHLLRPLFFLPVVFICVSGGIIFGIFAGTVYSIIGITLSSIVFYFIIRWMPKFFDRFIRMKHKLIGKHTELTLTQISLLRLVPFIHFHLLSICLLEISIDFKDYMRSSFISNIPLAIVYTSVGGWLSSLSPIHILLSLAFLLLLIYGLRRKEIIIKWEDFFSRAT
ncbi:TVP38/TMEM64 family protein [Ornithinibacillus contaminans]|uniref:TVP38/TMEM64 family protein n=1 Tax=Ornithinibacillus contaminans TaxID=694055 RepID=UPI00064DACC9|nr:VTT domain-containing protein [Ornithinibacillus contaminans]